MSNFVSAAYHPDLLTVEFTNEDGDHYLRSGGTIAWRFNNPGNVAGDINNIFQVFTVQ